MATIEQALYTGLTGYSDLATLIGTRLYPVVLPENDALPAVAYQRISTVSTEDRDSSVSSDDLNLARFQFDVVAESALSARAVALVLRRALRSLIGATDPRIDAVFMDNQYDGYEDTSRYFTVSLDAIVQYLESV